MIKTLLQSEYEKHESQRDNKRHRFSPLEHNFGRRHGEMLDFGSFCQGDVRRPVLLLDQLLNVTHAVRYHIVKHERVQTGHSLLR